jgi:hypothetical protein
MLTYFVISLGIPQADLPAHLPNGDLSLFLRRYPKVYDQVLSVAETHGRQTSGESGHAGGNGSSGT